MTTSQPMNAKPSMFSLLSNNNTPGATTLNQASAPTLFRNGTNRPCNNCTCSPGLLSRTGRRSTSVMRQMSISRQRSNPDLNRTASGSVPTVTGGNARLLNSPSKRSTRNSIYTMNSCDSLKEINTSKRLEKLRNLMKLNNLSVYIVPSQDSHQSEYTSNCDQRRFFISGFSGSAGVALITNDLLSMNDKPSGLSALATDGRYFNQAINELDFNWTLLKQGQPDVPTWQEWCINEAYQMSLDSAGEEDILIGIDPSLITYDEYVKFNELIKVKAMGNNKIKLVSVKENLIDKIWDLFEEKPIRKFQPLIELDIKYTGLSVGEKLNKINSILKENYQSEYLIINALDEIAWLLNLRGNDIEYNPVFYSYLIIDGMKLTLYTDEHERFEDLMLFNNSNLNINLKKYDEIWKDIETTITNERVLITNTSSWKIVESIEKNPINNKFLQIESPLTELKSIKNSAELQGAIESHNKDGLALVKYFSWLENELVNKGNLLHEYEAALKLESLRKELPNFISLSFETISSTGSNSAIIHYAPPKSDNSTYINPKKIYLCDSGSQFLEGTTDTTRTLHFTQPTQEEIKNYTLVLKGHIQLSMLKFPQGTTGLMIDCIARQFLWSQGLDYSHGTGHGVGAFLNVHEGPMGIGIKKIYNDYLLKPGQLISNEPGYYKDGHYGIRIENMFYILEDDQLNKTFTTNKKFYKFKTVTKVPYCRKLIDVKMLSREEIQWINEYHDEIWKEMNGKLIKGSIEYNWLRRETKKL